MSSPAPSWSSTGTTLLNTLPGKLPWRLTRVGAGEGLDYRAEGLVSDGEEPSDL